MQCRILKDQVIGQFGTPVLSQFDHMNARMQVLRGISADLKYWFNFYIDVATALIAEIQHVI